MTVIFQEEVAPVAGALAAHHGHGNAWLVALACAVGTWSGDVVLYVMGRHGRRLLDRSAFRRALDLVQLHPRLAPLAVRFAYGLRFTLPIACGAARLPAGSYAVWVGLSAAIWSASFTALGWLAGAAALRLFHDLEHYEWPAMAIIAVLAIGAFLFLRRRNRVRAQLDAVTADA